MVFYITGVDNANESFAAYATACPQDSSTKLPNGRPTVGMIAINFYHLRKAAANAKDFSVWPSTITHEISHAMGFNNWAFKEFVKYGSIVRSAGNRDVIVAPNVLAYAKEYFGCDNVTSLPLEDNGGSGSKGSHWERVSFGNEYMTASQIERAAVSKFTLLVFEASGWYSPIFEEAQDFDWGKGEGCKFVTGSSCISNSEEFCGSGSGNFECNWDYASVGGCKTYDQFAPNCGYWAGQEDCVFSHGWDSAWRIAGGTSGPKSKCWETNALQGRMSL